MDDIEINHDPSRIVPRLEAAPERLARELLAAGADVVDAWEPVQMAVMSLVLELDGVRVVFDSERGYSTAFLEVDGHRTFYPYAVYAWSQAPDADGRPHLAEHRLYVRPRGTYGPVGGRPESLAEVGHWREVLPWFRTADPALLDRVSQEVLVAEW